MNNLLKKLFFNNYNVKNTVSDYFPLLNINNNQLELKNDEVLRMYYKEDFFSTSNYSEDELSFLYNHFNNYFKNSKSGDGFSCLIKINKNNKTFENELKEEVNFPLINTIKNNKLNFIKNKNKKFINVFFGTSSYYFNNSFISLMDKLDYKQMNNNQLFSFLFDHFNPSAATNDLDLKSLPPLTKEQLKAKEYTLLEILYNSYIDCDNDKFEVGNTKFEVYNITAPAESLDINKLVQDLSKLKSNVNISIKAKKDDAESFLKMKATFAGSALLGISTVNRRISENINNLLSYLKDKHNNLCSVNISLFVYNENIDELNEDKLNFEQWLGVEYILNRFNRTYEYIYSIPGLNIEGNHSIYVPSDYVAALCLPNQYYKTFTNSIFFDKYGIVQPFDYKLKSRKVNSGAIIAPTRSGKSVLLNAILCNKLIKNYNRKLKKFDTFGLLIDFGNSYNRQIDAFNSFLSPEHQISYKSIGLKNKYNILDMNFGYPINANDINNKTTLLLQFFEIALDNLTSKERVLLSKSIEKTYERFLFGDLKKISMEGVIYWDEYVNSNYTNIDMFLNSMPLINDIIGVMASDVGITNSFDQDVVHKLNDNFSLFLNSKEGEIFVEKSNELLLSDILVVDFEEITQQVGGKLPALFLQMLINYKYQEFISDRLEGYEKFIFIDEYPQFLKIEPKIENTVDFLLKTGQKKNLDIFIISQNIKTLKQDFFPNLGTLTLFNLNLPSEIKNLSEIISIDESYFKPIKELEFVRDKYSDLMVMEISNEKLLKSTLRFELTKTELQLFTKKDLMEIEELKY